MQVINGQMSIFDRDMPCGKTSPEHIAATKARTSVRCSKSSLKSKTPMPLFLDLRRGGVSGLIPGSSWVTGIPLLGERSTLNFGESPSVAEGSGLWQILEDNVPLKYYLSAKACAGVLRRAEKRGKALDPVLRTALEQQIERWEKFGSPLPIAELNVTDVLSVDNHAQDGRYTLRGNKVQTLSSKMGEGGDNVPYVLYAYVIVLDRAAFNQGINARFDMGISDDGKAFTLTARGPGAVCYGVSTDNSSTCGNVGCDEELSPTLQAKKRAAVIYGETQYVVRRLTPLECCRLQGMPDWWEEGVSGSDVARYKMWGNGMALPNALYVMEGFYN